MKGKEILNQLKKLPGAGDYPGADGVIIYEETCHRLEPDGRIKTYKYFLRRLFTALDKDKNADIHVLFNEKLQKINIMGARTYSEGDRIVDTPEYAINQITPPALDRAPHYVDFQEKVISLLGIERGSILELEYEIEDLKPWRTPFCGEEPLWLHYYPAIQRKIRFEIPEKKEFFVKFKGTGEKPEVSEAKKNGYRFISCTLKDVPQWDYEDGHILRDATRPALRYSEKGTPEDKAVFLWQRVDKATVKSSYLMEKVNKILEGITVPLERALKVHKYVVEAVDTIKFSPHYTFFSSRTAEEILRSGYGNTFEKAVLLRAMLGAAGFEGKGECEVGFAFHEPAVYENDYYLSLSHSVWVIVKSLGLYVRPDVSLKEGSRIQLQGNHLLLATKERDCVLRFDTPGTSLGNFLDAKINVKIKEDFSVEGELDVVLSGLYNPFHGIFMAKKDAADSYGKELPGKFFPDAEIKEYAFTHMDMDYSVVKASFKSARIKQDSENRFELVFPFSISSLAGVKIPWSYMSRMSFYEINGSLRQKIKMEITHPDQLVVTLKPGVFEIKNDALELVQTFEQKENKLTVDYFAEIKKKHIPAEEYQDLRALLARDSLELEKTLLLTQKS